MKTAKKKAPQKTSDAEAEALHTILQNQLEMNEQARRMKNELEKMLNTLQSIPTVTQKSEKPSKSDICSNTQKPTKNVTTTSFTKDEELQAMLKWLQENDKEMWEITKGPYKGWTEIKASDYIKFYKHLQRSMGVIDISYAKQIKEKCQRFIDSEAVGADFRAYEN
ncbi:MAG: hypothetical protein AB9903_12930 [Vulcanimicrobiota bacterium]